MKKEKYGFPLCIQLSVPENLFTDKEFAKVMELLKEKEFYGVELNITDFEGTDPDKLKDYLDEYGLRMTMLASGAYAKAKNLSLSSEDEEIRRHTVEEFHILEAFAEKMHAGIICGFIKGSAGVPEEVAARQIQKSLTELKSQKSDSGVEIYLEATNHYEASVVRTLEEGARIVQNVGSNIRVLPDTYHMNIEEAGMFEAMVKYQSMYENIHISDNNRYFPGFGAIDFMQVFRTLKGMNYQGTVTIEGRCHGSLEEDIRKSCDYLENIGKRLG